LSIRAFADNVVEIPNAPPYVTIDNFIRKGSGNLDTAWAITKLMGLTLNDNFVEEDKQFDTIDMVSDNFINTNGSKTNELFENLLDFLENNDSKAGIAAKRCVDILAQKLEKGKNVDEGFHGECLNFIIIEAEEFNNLNESVIIKFLKSCKENNAEKVIKQIVNNYTSPSFYISLERLLFFAIQLAKVNFIDESTRCFDRAAEKMLDEKVYE